MKEETLIDKKVFIKDAKKWVYPEKDVKEFIQWCLKWKSKNIETKEDDFLVIPMKKFKKRAGGDLITNIKENGTK